MAFGRKKAAVPPNMKVTPLDREGFQAEVFKALQTPEGMALIANVMADILEAADKLAQSGQLPAELADPDRGTGQYL